MRLNRLGVALAFVLCAAGEAAAYPQFQLATGNARCSVCHIAPTGGGLINDYGRFESGDTISQLGGDGSFLHGAYDEPDWIKLGVDLRAMALVRQYPGEVDPDFVAFPMLGDTYAALLAGDFTLYGAVGPRAQVRRPDGVLDRFGAREYWLMWRPNVIGSYARVGRFLAPFGLRHADHTVYTRRYQGLNAWEETFSLSAGHVQAGWEGHITAFVPVPSAAQGYGQGERGAATYWEKRVDDDETMIVAAEGRVGVADDSRRYTAGAIGKYWMPGAHLLVMGQVDVTLQDFVAAASPSRGQLASYLGASWFPRTGLMATAAFERWAPDLAVEHTAFDAYSATLQYFPLAHWEVVLQGKIELLGSYGQAQRLALAQLHYYL